MTDYSAQSPDRSLSSSQSLSPSPLSSRRRQLLQTAGVTVLAGAAPVVLLPTTARAATSVLPPLAVRVMTKMGFGPRPGDIAAFNALGGNDSVRLTAYVDQQLNPDAIDDSALQAKLTGFNTLDQPLEALWRSYVKRDLDWEQRMRPVFDTERVAFLRAIYSRRQLVEVLADFWHNHFNVDGRGYWSGPTFVHYDRDVIRRHLLGNFRELLEAVTQSTAMMYYLDNVSSRATGPNENFARECLELYALGARNGYGFAPEDSVPSGPDGVKLGYTEADVKAFARCLTGWTVQNGWQWPPDPNDNNNGTFLFRDDWHDIEPKRVLGVSISGQGIEAAREVFDRLAAHPKTAEFVCTKLCRRLVSDNPPAELVSSAAEVFQRHWQAPDQLARVTRTILLSEAFRNSWGEKTKRPFETMCSALRALDADISLAYNDVSPENGQFWFDSQSFLWLNRRSGHYPFGWPAPNGYPDNKNYWLGSTQLVMSWRILSHAVNHWGDRRDRRVVDVVAVTLNELPEIERSAEGLVDFWSQRLLGYIPDPAQRQRLVDFMAQDTPPDIVLDIASDEWATDDASAYIASRLRTLVALILMLPEFLNR